jgi:hypothetical protein
MNYYNNLPSTKSTKDSAQSTVNILDNYNKNPIQVDASTYDAMIAFFESKSFGKSAAESMTSVIIRQAKLDGLNPLTIIETLTGLGELQISNLVTEIVNYNRYKTSSIGYASPFLPSEEISRNIAA